MLTCNPCCSCGVDVLYRLPQERDETGDWKRGRELERERDFPVNSSLFFFFFLNKNKNHKPTKILK